MLADSYRRLKEKIQQQEEWRRHTFASGGLAENQKKKSDGCKSFRPGTFLHFETVS